MCVESIDSKAASRFPRARQRYRCMQFLRCAALAVSLLPFGVVVAQEPTPDATQAAAPVADPVATGVRRSEKVCAFEDVTGSRMKRRVCYTPEQREARERAGREMTRGLDARPVAGEEVGG